MSPQEPLLAGTASRKTSQSYLDLSSVLPEPLDEQLSLCLSLPGPNVTADVPSLNNASVVSVQDDMGCTGNSEVENVDKELKGNGFCPANVLWTV